MFTLRFDLRAPDSTVPIADRYAAAIEMCSWAEDRGALAAVLSEHHGTADGYLPAPTVLAAAIAARTERLPILLAALVLPLYDPVRLAEELSLLDIVSRGRVVPVFGVGHRDEEYEHFGVDVRQRGRLADEHLSLVLDLLRGEPVQWRGRRIHVTPPPMTPGGPTVMIGGGSAAAVRRAARHGLGFLGQAAPPGLADLYESECRAHGHEPGLAQFPDPAEPTAVFVADDVDAAWHELGPHLLHDAVSNAAWRQEARGQEHGGVASISYAGTVEELRKESSAYVVLTGDEAAAHVRAGRVLNLAPLCGGVPPDVGWRYLEAAASAVAAASTGG